MKRGAGAPRLTPLRLAAASLLIVLLLRLLGEVEWGRAAAALSRTQAGLVVLAALLNLTLNSAVRVARRAALLMPLPHAGRGVGYRELGGLLFTNYAANSLLPARAGDALFVAQLNRRHGYPLGTLVGAQLVERVVEATSLWVFAWPVACLVPLPLALALPLYTFLGVGTACLLVLTLGPGIAGKRWVASAPERDDGADTSLRSRIRRQLDRLREALRLMHAPQVWSRAVLWSCASDCVDALMIGLCLIAVGIHVPLGVWLLVLLVVNLAILVPITPGQIGVLEAGAVVALRLLGVGASEALVFALLYHAAHIIPMSVAGAVALVSMGQGATVDRG